MSQIIDEILRSMLKYGQGWESFPHPKPRPSSWSALPGCSFGEGQEQVTGEPCRGHRPVQWRISSSASWETPAAPDPRGTQAAALGDTLRFCGDPGHVPLRHPLPAPPGAQPASLCSAIFKTPKESSHLRLLETWRVPPAIRRSQEPCSFSNPPELASDIKPNKQTERGLLCKKSSSELVISGL